MISPQIYMKYRHVAAWLLSFVPVVITLIVLPILPDTIATHYGLDGADNYGSKYAMLVLPIISIAMGSIWFFSGVFTHRDENKEKVKQNMRILLWFDIFSSLLFTIITIILLCISYEQADSIVNKDLDLLTYLAISCSI
ncbi:MAG: DUF1648 domain-containing protein [Peptococcaceae bacterium]|nr:DUF1648 domain-containing protein [Peptococcaceae bacterium]